jgi:Leucine-rich repeat (LRR) protein
MVPGGMSDAWLTPSLECDWGGVACNVDERVNRIEFGTKQSENDYRNIAREILCFANFCVSSLYHFSRTETNGVSGTLPAEIDRLQALQFLLLERGALTGTIPPEVGGIRTLLEIDLNFNLLRGSIPNSLYFLSNLETLDLNDNNLVGPISTRIGRLRKLDFFQIENNAFTGTIPTEMGLLSLLRTCILNDCSLLLT